MSTTHDKDLAGKKVPALADLKGSGSEGNRNRSQSSRALDAQSADSPRRSGEKMLKKQLPSLDLHHNAPEVIKKKSSVGGSSPTGDGRSEGSSSSEAPSPHSKRSAMESARGDSVEGRKGDPKKADKKGEGAIPATVAKAPATKPGSLKSHRFVKKHFAHPTWCIFAEKFIWGLEKSGYECQDCKLGVSRRHIAEAKTTICGDISMALGAGTAREAAQTTYTKTKVFTVHLPQGAKKSFLLNPMQPLVRELEKICFARNIKMEEYVAMDTNGQPVALNTTLGKIQGGEITFTAKDAAAGVKRVLPPTFDEAYAKMGITRDAEADKARKMGGFGNPAKALTGFLDIRGGRQARKSRVTRPDGVNTIHEEPADATAELLSPKPRLPVTERYTIGRELGAGAFSVVYEGTENTTGTTYAIKILDRLEDDDAQAAKFKHEIDIISSLKHENIVDFIELDEDDEHYYVVMELVQGGELFDQIVERSGFKSKDAASLIAQILKALEFMHKKGTAHRDMKPENILFKDKTFETVKIADFGESKKFDEGPLSTYCGTPDYMAPEIIKGQPYGPEVDMWAIGVISYVCLAGFPPFDGENDVEVFASILGVKYDFPSPEWDEVPQDAKDFIAAILIDDPSKRLTATQALNHPWIMDNVEEKYRVNKEPEPAPVISISRAGDDRRDSVSDSGKESSRETSRETQRGSLTAETAELGPLDMTNNPSSRLLEVINDTQLVARSSLSFMGELVTMEAIVRTLMGDPAEQLVLPIYWNRLQAIRKIAAADKGGKSKGGKKKK